MTGQYDKPAGNKKSTMLKKFKLEDKQTYIDRLQKIVDSDFINITKGTNRTQCSFGVLNSSVDGFDKNGCGTAGCLMGEFPMIFPEDWEFEPYGKMMIPKLSNSHLSASSPKSHDQDTMRFFNLNQIQQQHLFYHEQQRARYGNSELTRISTREAVINNLKVFIARLKDGQFELNENLGFMYESKEDLF